MPKFTTIILKMQKLKIILKIIIITTIIVKLLVSGLQLYIKLIDILTHYAFKFLTSNW